MSNSKGHPVCVESGKPVVDQLCSEVQGVVNRLNAVMLSFMRLIDIEDGHDLSPFGIDFENKDDFRATMENYFLQRL